MTTAGNLTAVFVQQAQKTFFAGPTTGSPADPAFRGIEITDLPALAQGSVYVGTGLGGVVAGTLNGYNGITITSDSLGTINITGSNGTLTFVDLAVPAEWTIAGSPLTGSGGTITLSKASQNKNHFWAGPVSGPSAQPAFRELDVADLAPLNMTDGQLIIGYAGGAPVLGNLMNGSNIVITNTPGGILISASLNTSAIGTVYSVDLALPASVFNTTGGPVTSSGTLTGAFVDQAANVFFAGPTFGAASTPSFRSMVLADLPALLDGQIYVGQDGNGATISALTQGPGIVIANTAGSTFISTNISVGLSLPASIFSVSNSPVTGFGTLTGTLSTQSANAVFAGPVSGGAATPTFRSLVLADLPALGNGQLYIGNGGVPTVSSLSAGTGITITPGPGTLTITNAVAATPVAANLVYAGPVTGGPALPVFRALDVGDLTTGILPIARGGTNSGSALNNDRIMVSSGGSIVEAAALTNGQLLIGSTGGAPVGATLTGTANRVLVSNGAGSITLSTPQDIHTAATPTFASAFLTATTNQLTLGTTNTVTLSATAPNASRTYTLHDAGANANLVLGTGGALTVTNTGSTNQVLVKSGTTTASWQTPVAFITSAIIFAGQQSTLSPVNGTTHTYTVIAGKTYKLEVQSYGLRSGGNVVADIYYDASAVGTASTWGNIAQVARQNYQMAANELYVFSGWTVLTTTTTTLRVVLRTDMSILTGTLTMSNYGTFLTLLD